MIFKPMTEEVRKKILFHKKNRLDIANLIKDYEIKNEDLSNSIISFLDRHDTDISGCNFSNSIIGNPNSSSVAINIIHTKMNNCIFEGARFISVGWMRKCIAENCNFKNADVSLCDYQYTNFGELSKFCGAKITISTSAGIGAHFPRSLFEELCKGWDISIEVKSK